MADMRDFQEKQYAFARHIRDPDNQPAPEGVEDRRMAIYRELFFNNLKSLLSTTFPVLNKILDKEKWSAIIRQFMAGHEAQTPYFLEIPQEFVQFLQHEYELQDDDVPFLIELAHYEWVELALSVADEVIDLSGIDINGDFLARTPVASNLAWSYTYEYPVHRISSDFQPVEAGQSPTFLAIRRDVDNEMGFMELNPITMRLFELIKENDHRNGEELLKDLAKEINYPDPGALVEHGAEAMQKMQQAGILLGVK